MRPATELRAGMVIRLDGDVYRVLHAEYHAGGGQMRGAVHARLQNVHTGSITERRFRQEERLEAVELRRQTMEYLYDDGDLCVFMHPETFEQIELPRARLGPFARFIQPNQRVEVRFLDEAPVEVAYPETVDLKVERTSEAIHTEDSTLLKPAVLENGMEVQVPQFVKPGDMVRIEVATGRYVERLR